MTYRILIKVTLRKAYKCDTEERQTLRNIYYPNFSMNIGMSTLVSIQEEPTISLSGGHLCWSQIGTHTSPYKIDLTFSAGALKYTLNAP